MDKSMVMLHSGGFATIPMQKRYFWLSRAYLEASRVLCNAIIEEDFTRQYSSTRVILNLCRHAVELFLKGAIAIATSRKPPRTHDLAKLTTRYRELYPDAACWFTLPFDVEHAEGRDMFPQLTAEFHRTLDQRYRYPESAEGQPFDTLEGFVPGSFLLEIERLSRELLVIELRITGGNLV